MCGGDTWSPPLGGVLKIKLLTSMCGRTSDGVPFSASDGDVVEMDDATAQRLIDSGQAEAVPEVKEIKAKGKTK